MSAFIVLKELEVWCNKQMAIAALKETALLSCDDQLRFIQRVLESDAPYEDRARAAQMVRDIRRAIRPLKEKP